MHDEISAEALDEEIVQLFANVFAFTARALAKLALFDRRELWAAQSHQSCAHYLNFRVGISLGAAREHVRVARALEGLPETAAKFAAGSLSYSKVRALTRLATADNERELLELAEHTTGAQLEKIVRACRRVTSEEAKEQAKKRSVRIGYDDDGMFTMHVSLLPDEGARLMQAIDALLPEDTSRTFDERRADGLMELGSTESRTEVVLHLDADAPPQVEAGNSGRIGVSAQSARRLACDCSTVEMTHDSQSGRVLDLGRKTRKISKALRRALSERDRGCRFPGCANRRVDNHHIVHWQDGGETNMVNLCQLCRAHHVLVHEGGYRIEASAHDLHELTFYTSAGTRVLGPQPMPVVALAPMRAEPWAGVDWTWQAFDAGRCVSALVDH